MTLQDKSSKAYKVIREKSNHASNSLSNRPGGAAVYVEYKNGSIRHYDNVKFPKSYIKRIWDNDDKKEIKDVWTISE